MTAKNIWELWISFVAIGRSLKGASPHPKLNGCWQPPGNPSPRREVLLAAQSFEEEVDRRDRCDVSGGFPCGCSGKLWMSKKTYKFGGKICGFLVDPSRMSRKVQVLVKLQLIGGFTIELQLNNWYTPYWLYQGRIKPGSILPVSRYFAFFKWTVSKSAWSLSRCLLSFRWKQCVLASECSGMEYQ